MHVVFRWQLSQHQRELQCTSNILQHLPEPDMGRSTLTRYLCFKIVPAAFVHGPSERGLLHVVHSAPTLVYHGGRMYSYLIPHTPSTSYLLLGSAVRLRPPVAPSYSKQRA